MDEYEAGKEKKSQYTHYKKHYKLHLCLPTPALGFRSGEFAGQSSTVTPWSLNQLLVPLAVWAGARSCWKIKPVSP